MKNLLIALIILLPAVVLVSLYPTMERIAEQRQKEWMEKAEVPIPEDYDEYRINEDLLTNYAVEASYYLYSQMLQEATGQASNTEILEYYGWLNDFDYMNGNSRFYAEYIPQKEETQGQPAEESTERYTRTNTTLPELEAMLDKQTAREQWDGLKEAEDALACLVIEYDGFGKLSDICFYSDGEMVSGLRQSVVDSEKQYEENLYYYMQETGESEEFRQSAREIQPKNFRAVFMIDDNEESRFCEYYYESYGYSPHLGMPECYLMIGAYWVVLACAAFVALAAIILPFFKKLETGWEKLFRLPLEIVGVLIGVGIPGAFWMSLLMSETRLSLFQEYIKEGWYSFEFLGYQFNAKEIYAIFLLLNFLGWALLFFAEYICVAQLRQFFCNPKEYLKNRLLIVRFARWIGRKWKQLIGYVTDIDINEGLHKSILKVVLVNFAVLTVICCFWFFGIIGIVLYSIGLYVLLKKYGNRLQTQYRSILEATNQMAEGDLHIVLEEDLGLFTPLGTELSRVQQGFSKAVAEEAKSQNMKTELITNVSHDLKTPLTAIITYVDLLKNENLTEEERASYIHTLDLKSQRLKVLIEDLFEVSKANSGNVQMNFMDVDIVNLMKEVRVEMEDKLCKSNLDFRWNLPEEKIVLKLDGQRTYRIFENILNNAVKYAMPFTRVYVDMVCEQDMVMVVFKNMSAQELNFDAEHLTERFVRGDSARNSEGSGLGLAIAKSFTELQNGDFKIDIDGDLFKVTIRFPMNGNKIK